ncbi:MAG: hypothetical protein HYX99_01495 [Chloroflexi bacterium]|nr:hypothetical protein [Chloroflexota bacterium]
MASSSPVVTGVATSEGGVGESGVGAGQGPPVGKAVGVGDGAAVAVGGGVDVAMGKGVGEGDGVAVAAGCAVVSGWEVAVGTIVGGEAHAVSRRATRDRGTFHLMGCAPFWPGPIGRGQ